MRGCQKENSGGERETSLGLGFLLLNGVLHPFYIGSFLNWFLAFLF